MKKYGLISTLSSLLLLCASCTLGPDYIKPDIQIPASFKEAPEGWKLADPQDSCARGPWWEMFEDPKLNELEVALNQSNQTLAAAVAQYSQARTLVSQARSAYFPTASTNGSITKEKQSLSNDQVAQVGIAGTSSSIVSDTKPFNIINVGIDTMWEPDIWGAVRRNVESKIATAESDAAYVVLTQLLAQASLAQYYFQLRGLDALQDLLDKTVKDYEKLLKITLNQYHSGTASRLNVLQSQSALEAAQAAAQDNGINRAIYEHAIAVLIGSAPSEFCLPPNPLVTKTVWIPVSVPSVLLERRPDIAQAERLVAAASASIGVAIAAYFPTLSLTGTEGYQADVLHRLFRTPSQFWSIGAMLFETLFDAGLRSAQVDAARAAYDEAVANYRQTVLAAFQDVEDQLASLRILEQEQEIQRAAVESAEGALRIIMNEYKAGTVATQDVLTQEITTFTIKQAEISVMTRRMVASALLVKALGGGWDIASLEYYDGSGKCGEPYVEPYISNPYSDCQFFDLVRPNHGIRYGVDPFLPSIPYRI